VPGSKTEWGGFVLSPVPKGEGPGAPSLLRFAEAAKSKSRSLGSAEERFARDDTAWGGGGLRFAVEFFRSL